MDSSIFLEEKKKRISWRPNKIIKEKNIIKEKYRLMKSILKKIIPMI